MCSGANCGFDVCAFMHCIMSGVCVAHVSCVLQHVMIKGSAHVCLYVSISIAYDDLRYVFIML